MHAVGVCFAAMLQLFVGLMLLSYPRALDEWYGRHPWLWLGRCLFDADQRIALLRIGGVMAILAAVITALLAYYLCSGVPRWMLVLCVGACM